MTIPKQAQVRETGWSTCWKAQSPQRIIRRMARVSKKRKIGFRNQQKIG